MNPVLESAWGIWIMVGMVGMYWCQRAWIWIVSEGEFGSIEQIFNELRKRGWVAK